MTLTSPEAKTEPSDQSLYETPWPQPSVADCEFYHVMDVPGVGQTGGQWDLRRSFDSYLGHVNFQDKRVLDVGSASGFLTFEIEKRGGTVVSFDASEKVQKDLIPFHADLSHRQRRIDEINHYTRRMKNSYWLTHRALGSKAQAFYGNVYDLPEALGRFDVVVIAQILVHLRDPVAAIASACRLSDDTVVITEGMPDTPVPFSLFYPTPDRPELNQSWSGLSVGMYRRLLRILGFGVVSVTRSLHRCTVPGMRTMHSVTTIVARRSALAAAAAHEQSFGYRLRYRLAWAAMTATELVLGEAKRGNRP